MHDTGSAAAPNSVASLRGAILTPPPPPALSGERAVVWILWLTYGAFYFCRTNISAAVPGLKAAVTDGGLGLSPAQVGWILASSKIAYGLGQFLNGQLSERFSPRVMLAIGMFGSAALNVLFGFSAGFFFLLLVWATNGFCQSLGWTPTMRVAANWFPTERRGKSIGIIGTGYQITFGLTYLIAGQSAEALGWRGAMYVPAIFLAVSGVIMLLFLREAPADPPAETNSQAPRKVTSQGKIPLAEGLYCTLFNPALWLLGLTLGLLNACRYGYFDWGLTHLMETRDMPVSKAALQYFVIAIGATAGSYLAGWATDRFFGSRRAPVICLLMVALSVLSLVYGAVVAMSAIGTMVLLVLIGFCIIGPQVLLVGTAPADLAHRGTSAAAAGFVNFMGYVGAATGDVVTGHFSAPENGGWQVAIYIWAGWALAGAAVTALLWNTTSKQVGLLSGTVPKVGAMALLAGAGAAIALGGQPLALQVATWVAVACVAGTFFRRELAVPAMIIAATGLLTVFVLYLRRSDGIRWDEAAAMAAYGLTMVAGLMILVEEKGKICE